MTLDFVINFPLTFVLVASPQKSPHTAIRERQGDRIRLHRKLHKMSQEALASSIGVTKAAVSDWERGVSTPRQAHQVAIAQTLNTPWSALFGLDAERVA